LGGLPKANTPREARSAQAKESRRQEKLFEQHAVVAIKKKDFPHTDSGRFRWSVIFPFITPYRSYGPYALIMTRRNNGTKASLCAKIN
jgi:hypothetical protein